MKKSSLILMIIFLFTSSLFQAAAQDKVKDDKEKEKKIQEAIEAQKKAMTEQEAALKDVEKAMQEQKIVLEKTLKEVPMGEDEMELFDNAVRIYDKNRKIGQFYSQEPFIISPGVEFYGHSFNNDSERTTWEFSKSVKGTSFSREYTFDVEATVNTRTTWEFSKSVKGTSFSREYTFDVEATVNTVVMSVIGDCKEGEIRIKIVMPGGKTYSDIVIDEFGNLNWRKSFTISETENKDKAGAWKYEISSVKASGYFKISLQTY